MALFLRELCGLKAVMTLPPAGTSNVFDYSKGGKQGAVETPEIWNAVIDYLLEPVILSWRERNFGFELDSGVHISHAIWCDNIILFASSSAMLRTMIENISDALGDPCLYWKPSSLEVLLCGGSTLDELSISQRGLNCHYNVV